MTKRALKKLSRLERKFSGPNAGLVWGIWPVWFVDPKHPFHWPGVYHDLDYLLREMLPPTLISELRWRLSIADADRCINYVKSAYKQSGYIVLTKSREAADYDLLVNMLAVAGDDKKLIRTAHIAYRVVRLLGGFWW